MEYPPIDDYDKTIVYEWFGTIVYSFDEKNDEFFRGKTYSGGYPEITAENEIIRIKNMYSDKSEWNMVNKTIKITKSNLYDIASLIRDFNLSLPSPSVRGMIFGTINKKIQNYLYISDSKIIVSKPSENRENVSEEEVDLLKREISSKKRKIQIEEEQLDCMKKLKTSLYGSINRKKADDIVDSIKIDFHL